jgi:polysaccharide transporter, PST family
MYSYFMSFLDNFIPEFFKSKLRNRPILQKILKNISWLSFDRLFQLVVSFFIGLWVARYLGPGDFGIFNFIIAMGAIIMPFIGLGVSNLLVRELVRIPDKKYELLGTSFFIYLVTGAIAFFVLILSIFFLRQNDPFVTVLAIIFYIGNFFVGFDLIGGWFGSKVESRTVIFYKDIALVIVAALKIFFMFLGLPLFYLVLATSVEIILRAILLLLGYIRDGQNVFKWKFNFKIAKNLLKESWPLVFSGLMLIIYMRIDQVMIGVLLTDFELGIYSSAVKISELFCFFPAIVVGSLLPSLVRMRKNDKKRYLVSFQKLFDVLTWLAIIFVVPVFFLSSQIILLLYGVDYLLAAGVLSVLIISIIAIFARTIVDTYLINEKLTKVVLVNSFFGATTNVGLNILLIPVFGIGGAAVSTVISYFVALLGILLFKKTRGLFFIFLKSFNLFGVIKRNLNLVKK